MDHLKVTNHMTLFTKKMMRSLHSVSVLVIVIVSPPCVSVSGCCNFFSLAGSGAVLEQAIKMLV